MSREVFFILFVFGKFGCGVTGEALCEPSYIWNAGFGYLSDVRAGDGRVCGGSAFQGTDRRCPGGPVPEIDLSGTDRYADGACPAGDFEILPGRMPEPAMKYVVVRHEEQMTEDAYVLNEGTAYVPLFSERDLVLFQDENETRYARVNCAIQPVFTDMEELLQTCFEMNPMHPFLFMNACAKACRKEVLTGDDAILLEHADQKMELHPLFRAKVLSAIVRYYKRMADGIEDAKKDGSVSYLLSLDKDQLTRDERNGVCGTLIRCGHFSEAYEMVCRYGLEGLPVNLLLRLCGRMLLQNLFDRDDHLLYLTWYVFEHEKPDSVILDYLCEHFNGTVDQMYRVPDAGAAAPGGDVMIWRNGWWRRCSLPAIQQS